MHFLGASKAAKTPTSSYLHDEGAFDLKALQERINEIKSRGKSLCFFSSF